MGSGLAMTVITLILSIGTPRSPFFLQNNTPFFVLTKGVYSAIFYQKTETGKVVYEEDTSCYGCDGDHG